MLRVTGSQDFPSLNWPPNDRFSKAEAMNDTRKMPDKCEDPFTVDRWNDENHHSQRLQSQAMSFTFGGYPPLGSNNACISSNASKKDQAIWSPQKIEEAFRGFSVHNGELKKINPVSYGLNRSDKRRSSLSPAGSTDSLESDPHPTTWSAIVQKQSRTTKIRRSKPTKSYDVTLTACCSTPRIKFSCGSCNEEAFIKVKEELKPRIIPVSTSQLGFCRFCQTNGDPPDVYQSHSLRSDDGKVSCPVLREYNCPICNNGGGDFAHTVKYCPMARKTKSRSLIYF